jgi:hypothetical protein
MKKAQNGSLGFGSLHMLGFRFGGSFQLRLATDPDASDEPRGRSGWTFAYGDEPDFDRIIRFNDPVAPRNFIPSIGVLVSDAYIDSQSLNDSVVGQSVNLGPNSYFDGSNGADGSEPIINFEFHVGTAKEYIYSEASAPPKGTGVHATRNPLPSGLDVLLKSRTLALQASSNPIDKERLNNINRSLNLRYQFEVTYESKLDKKITFEPGDSVIFNKMKEKQIDNLFLTADFYGYDGDGLVGFVKGHLSAGFR